MKDQLKHSMGNGKDLDYQWEAELESVVDWRRHGISLD